MFHLKFLFVALAIFKIASSLPVEEKIQPVDLVYNCIKVEPDAEKETKSPVLLLHGMGGNRKTWNSLLLLLASRTKREACAVDLRNHGDSPWNNRSDIEALSTDISHFLDKHGIKKVNFIGHSLGGKTAIHFTLKNPDRVDSLVIEDITPNTMSQEGILRVSNFIPVLNAAMLAEESIPVGVSEEDAKKSIINFMNKKFEEMGYSEKVPEDFSKTMELKLVDGKWRFNYNIGIMIEFCKNFESFWTISSGLYEGRALFIYGPKSPFKVNEDKENILKLFPKAELLPVEGAGHMIHGVFPEFDDAVINFFNKVN